LSGKVARLQFVSTNISPLSAPTGAPTNPQTFLVTAESARLVWSPPIPGSENGIIRGYHINLTEINTTRQWEFFSVNTELLLDFLHPHYTYQCMIAAVTIKVGPFTPAFNFTTSEECKM